MRFQSPLYFLITQLFFSLFLINSSWVSGECLSNQSSLLLTLKKGFKTLNTARLSSWVDGSDCCSWEGVTCNKTSGLVIGIDLSSSANPEEEKITGTIDNSLFRLYSLQILNLSYNNFSMPLPVGFENLTRLTHLNLSNAGFTGQVPIEISRMTWLISLDLSTSFLSSSLSTALKLENPNLKTLVQNLSSLQELHLDGINMSMEGTKWSQGLFSFLSDLRVLSLSNCFLSGSIDGSLLRLPSLSKLQLGRNYLSSIFNHSFSDFSSINLRFLDLSFCKLRGQLPQNIFLFPYLQTLDISYNPNLTGSLPSFLPNNSSLEVLLLSYTNLGGLLPESIGNLKSLRKLSLKNCNFSGPIPTSLQNLTQLVLLDLSSNNFMGQIPLVGSSRVQIIDLSQNQLSGDIPPTFGKLLNLTKLSLKNNTLNGTIPSSLLALPLLQILDLSQNQLSGSITSFITNATNLNTLDLSYNLLSGSIPESIRNLTQLMVLVLSYNNFTGMVDFGLFQNFKNLTSLDLSGNNLVVEVNNASISGSLTSLKLASCNISEFPLQLNGKTNLTYLDLSNNNLKGEIPKWVWQGDKSNLLQLNLSHNLLTRVGEPDLSKSFLTVLDLHDNKLEGSLPLPPSATVLDYSSNRFGPTIPVNIGQSLIYTFYLSLSRNNFTGNIPRAICNAGYISVLDMSNNNFSGTIPKCVMIMSGSLSVLNLQGNHLQGIIPNGSSGICGLRSFNLNTNQLSGSIPISISNCMALEVLDLGNNHLNNTFPYWLQNLPQLRVLVLRSNQLHGSIEQVQGNLSFPALKIIDISSNRLTGNLPASFFKSLKSMTVDGEDHQPNSFLRFRVLNLNSLYYQDAVTVTTKGQEMQFVKVLTILTVVDFSNNRFDGSIPEELGKLNSLYVLNMSRNSLSGQIPVTLGNLSNLESLDLSNNRLSGNIPAELTGLNFLSFLELSNNQLYGRIPTEAQFSTFSDISFTGNQGLCGPPLPLQCTTSPPPVSDGGVTIMDDKQGFDWQFILVGVGFGAGMGVALGVLMVWKKGRKWCNGHMDRMLALLLPFMGLIYNDGRVGPEEKAEDLTGFHDEFDEEEEEEEDEEEEEEEAFEQQFCVFCTKLDVGAKRVIHKTCSCLLNSETTPLASFQIQL